MTSADEGACRSGLGARAPAGASRDAIRFGTSGWRGALGESVTFPRLRRLVRGIADWLVAESPEAAALPIAIGWDARFASATMAEMTARVLIDEGLNPILASRVTPTPAITHALARGRFAAGLVLTASHNPALDHGLKVFGASGAAIDDACARRIEAASEARRSEDARPSPEAEIARADFNASYRDALSAWLEPDRIRSSGMRVVFDAMHGCGGGLLDVVLREAGAGLTALRTQHDPWFGACAEERSATRAGAPDPVRERLGPLLEVTRETTGLVVGIATDGDGDRVAVSDGRGELLSETETVALLIDHLAVSGRVRTGVAITYGTGSLVERVARGHGLAVERHPVGFKHLSAAFAQGRADVAGEESGGFALASMGPDKDGLLAACLLVDLVARSREPLELHRARLAQRWGTSACGRTAVPWTAASQQAFEAVRKRPPARIDETPVLDFQDGDGLRFGLADGGFLILRCSGTESLVRIYAEASDRSGLAARLQAGCRLLD